MRTSFLDRASPWIIAIPLIAAQLAIAPDALAADPGVLGAITGMLPAGLGLERISSAFLGALSMQTLLGFLLGLAAGEFGRMVYKASLNAWKATLKFSVFAGQYGIAAVVLGAMLYFI